MASISGIYEIVNTINGHRYIGSAVNIQQRWSQHIHYLNNNKHHSRHLQSAWNLYGADAFEFSVIEACFIFALIFREQHYLNTLKPEYNISPTAGSQLGTRRTAETRANMSAARQYVSPETRAKMSAARKGTKLSADAKANLSVILKGNKRSLGNVLAPESRQKISASLIGNKHSLGYKQTLDHKEKISAANKGHETSTETRSKISESLRNFWAKKKNEK